MPLALGPLALGLLVLAVVARLDPPRWVADRHVYIIPPGTAERVERGLPVDDVLPQRIETRVGSALIVRNQDNSRHAFGPMILEPGQQWSRQFAVAGDYDLACSLYPGAGFTIAVQAGPVPGGLAAGLSTALSVLWLALTALTSGWLVAAALPGAERAARAWAHADAGLILLPGLALLAALGQWLAMSRVVPWLPAASGPIAVSAWFAALWTAGAVLVARRLFARPPALPRVDNLLLLAGALLWPAAQAARLGVGTALTFLGLGAAGLVIGLLLDHVMSRRQMAAAG